MQRKVKNNELKFIQESLVDLEIQLVNIKTYLDDNSWIDIDEDLKQKKEFKFQAELYDKFNVWLKQYMEFTGIVDFYEEAHNKKDTTLRKGSHHNALMEIIKEHGLDNQKE